MQVDQSVENAYYLLGILANSGDLEKRAVAAGLRSGDFCLPMLCAPGLLKSEFSSKVADMKSARPAPRGNDTLTLHSSGAAGVDNSDAGGRLILAGGAAHATRPDAALELTLGNDTGELPVRYCTTLVGAAASIQHKKTKMMH